MIGFFLHKRFLCCADWSRRDSERTDDLFRLSLSDAFGFAILSATCRNNNGLTE
jgi:hypothetical protein